MNNKLHATQQICKTFKKTSFFDEKLMSYDKETRFKLFNYLRVATRGPSLKNMSIWRASHVRVFPREAEHSCPSRLS